MSNLFSKDSILISLIIEFFMILFLRRIYLIKIYELIIVYNNFKIIIY